jgi:transposase InsO family protein
MTQIRRIFQASEQTYGSPRIHVVLRESGIRVGRKRVARLMRQAGLQARCARIYRRLPGTREFFCTVPNRIVDLETKRVNQVWVGDVTYLKSGGRWRYLAVVLDRHSRRVLGWHLGLRKDPSLTMKALRRALAGREVKRRLIFHSDRGVEYAAYAYRTRLAALGIIQSMRRRRRINDNAFMESFFHSMKSEALDKRPFDDDDALCAAIGQYMRRYNRTRLHSSLGYRSPIAYESEAA